MTKHPWRIKLGEQQKFHSGKYGKHVKHHLYNRCHKHTLSQHGFHSLCFPSLWYFFFLFIICSTSLQTRPKPTDIHDISGEKKNNIPLPEKHKLQMTDCVVNRECPTQKLRSFEFWFCLSLMEGLCLDLSFLITVGQILLTIKLQGQKFYSKQHQCGSKMGCCCQNWQAKYLKNPSTEI